MYIPKKNTRLEDCTHENQIAHGDLDFLNFVCKSIGSSVKHNF